MAATARRWLTATLLVGMLATPAARSQTLAPQPAATTPDPAISREFADLVQAVPDALPGDAPTGLGGAWQPPVLQYLPRPADQPGSLFQPTAPPGPPPPDLERYFELDPILDAPLLGQKPGWFTDTQIGLIHPHIFASKVQSFVKIPGVGGVRVKPGAANQSWTVAPRLEIGYWLPSGFGGFSFSDRFFSSSGTGPFYGPAGATTRTSRLGVNYSDWDYISREFTPWDKPWAIWTLKWRGGVRLAELWYDTQVFKPFDAAAPSNGIFAEHVSNYNVGAGPHFGVEVNRRALPSGFTFLTRLDIADTFTRERQLYSATAFAFSSAGHPARGAATSNFWQQVPILNFQVGLGWQPPSNPNLRVFAGYLYEFWWQTMTRSWPETTFGSISNQGVVLEVEMNW